jgi:hypothetical protein
LGLLDDSVETSTAAPVQSTMTFLLWVRAITAHDTSPFTLLNWGAPSGSGVIDPGFMLRVNPASSDRIEAMVGRAGVAAAAQANLALPGGVTDITTLAPFLLWCTINGTALRVGLGDPAAGVVATATITGGVDTGSTTGASLLARIGATDRGCAATVAAAVVGEVLSDAAIAAAASEAGPAAAAAASASPLWCPRPRAGLAATDPIVSASDILDTEGAYSHTIRAGSARLEAA